jgi:hypothetical protein
MDKTRCRGIFGFLFGHNFEDRYDRKSKSIASPNIITPEIIKAIESAAFSEDVPECINTVMNNNSSSENESIYICDVCVRCGQTITKQ